MGQDIYLDKIRLGALIVEKELGLIEQFNKLIQDLRVRPDLMPVINDYPNYSQVWRSASELYDFLEFDYAKKLSKEDQKKVHDIITKYRDQKSVKLEDLKQAVSIIRHLMSLSKFHDVTRKIDTTEGVDKIEKRYKL